MTVLKSFYQTSTRFGMGLKLFNDLPIEQSKLELIKEVFGTSESNSQTKDWDLGEMCDLLVLSPNRILMIEVKATVNRARSDLGKKGDKQPLARGAKFLEELLIILNINLPIQKVFFIPSETKSVIQTKLPKRDQYIYLGRDNLDADDLFTFLGDSGMMRKDNEVIPEKLLEALVLLLVGEVNNSSEDKILELMSQGVKGLKIVDNVLKQRGLEPVYKRQQGIFSQKKKKSAQQAVGEEHKIMSVRNDQEFSTFQKEILFFTPEQVRILRHVRNPKQIIFGPAATGKTLLIQAKCLQLIKSGKSVLLLIPHILHELYESVIYDNVKSSEKILLQMETPENMSSRHIIRNRIDAGVAVFIDEYYALVSSTDSECQQFLREMLESLKEDQLCWIAIDPLQPMDEKNFTPDINIPGMKDSTLSFLFAVQRCTRNVFLQWNNHCGRFVTLGYQFEGDNTEMEVLSEASDYRRGIDGIVDSISRCINLQLLNGWKSNSIAVIVDDKLGSGWNEMADIREKLEQKNKIKNIGSSSDAIIVEFMSACRKIHSYEWPIVICARRKSEYTEFYDYIIRSRAIFKLLILEYPPIASNSDYNPDLQMRYDSQKDIQDNPGFLKTINREIYTKFYDLLACEQFITSVLNHGEAVSEIEIIECLCAPLQFLAEGTLFFWQESILDPLEERYRIASPTFADEILQIAKDLENHLLPRLQLENTDSVQNSLTFRKVMQLTLEELLEKGENGSKDAFSCDDNMTAGEWLEMKFWDNQSSEIFFQHILSKAQYWPVCGERLMMALERYKPSLHQKLISGFQSLSTTLGMHTALCFPTQFTKADNLKDFMKIGQRFAMGLVFDIDSTVP